MRVKFVDVGGVPTRYLTEGSGAPLLLLHPGMEGAEMWLRNIDALGRERLVVAPDLLYHGFTGPVKYTGGLAYQHMLDHLAGLVDALGFGTFAAGGSSMGALLSALLFLRMPARVEKLILIGTGSCFNSDEEMAGLRKVKEERFIALEPHPTLEACRRRLANFCHDPASVPEEIHLTQMTAYALPGAAETRRAALSSITDPAQARPFRILHRLEQIKAPTLAVIGRQDPLAVYASTVAGVKRLPRGRLLTVEHCGHLPYVEHPELFNQAVLDFLREAF